MLTEKLNIFDKLYSYLVYSDEECITAAEKEGYTGKMRSRKKYALYFFIGMFILSLALPAIAITAPAVIGGLSLLLEIPTLICMLLCIRHIALDMSASSHNYNHWLLKWFREPNWVVSPTSSVRFLVMFSAWALDAILSPFRAFEYLIKDKTHYLGKNFDDITNRRAAYGSLSGTAIAVVGITLFCLLANPFTGLPLFSLLTAISLTILAGTLLAKTCEFMGRLSGAFRTKALAENELRNAAYQLPPPCEIELLKDGQLRSNYDLIKDLKENKKLPQYYIQKINENNYTAHYVKKIETEDKKYNVTLEEKFTYEETIKALKKEQEFRLQLMGQPESKGIEKKREILKGQEKYWGHQAAIAKKFKENLTNFIKDKKIAENNIIQLNSLETEKLNLIDHIKEKRSDEQKAVNHHANNACFKIKSKNSSAIISQTLKEIFLPRQIKGKKSGSAVLEQDNIEMTKLDKKKGVSLETAKGRNFFKACAFYETGSLEEKVKSIHRNVVFSKIMGKKTHDVIQQHISSFL